MKNTQFNYGIVFNDDGGAGSSGYIDPPPIIADVNQEPERPAVSDTITLSKAELQELVRSGVNEALQAQQIKSEPAVQASVGYDPTREALHAVDQRTDMIEEALDMFPDLPRKYQQKIRAELKNIAPDQIEAFRKGKYHQVVVRAVAMEAAEDGEYTPTKFRAKESPRVEPIGGSGNGPGVTQLGVPQPVAAEINEVFALLGLPKPDDKKLAQAYREPASSRDH